MLIDLVAANRPVVQPFGRPYRQNYFYSCGVIYFTHEPVPFIGVPLRAPPVRSDRCSGTTTAPPQSRRMDRCRRHPYNSPESLAIALRHRRNRLGPRPSSCDSPQAQTRARIADGRDGLRGNVSSHRHHWVLLTTFSKRLIERAAQLRGSIVTDFVVASAQQAAADTIRDFETLVLRDQARDVFINASSIHRLQTMQRELQPGDIKLKWGCNRWANGKSPTSS